MSLRGVAIASLFLVLAALLMFYFFQRELAGAWFTFGVHPEVTGLLERSLDDQKQLARRDPEHASLYHRRFDDVQRLLGRLRILELNRGRILWRYEALLLGIFLAILGVGSALYVGAERRQGRRLVRLQAALAELAAGAAEVRVGERRRDLIGRIAGMIEATSREITRARRRLASLENLSLWQEAARRQAHEMRTPLTAARLDLSRLRDLVDAPGVGDPEPLRLAASALEEIDRLARFTQEFTSFARLPEPRQVRGDLAAFVAQFVTAFAEAWPNLALSAPAAAPSVDLRFDPGMVRQVLVNLCDNSALALGDGEGEVVFSLRCEGAWAALEVADDGPGVPAAIRPRLFEPYVTTREVGRGMGLGLAISRKILLDHGGDLELVAAAGRGAVFRLLFPLVPPGEEKG